VLFLGEEFVKVRNLPRFLDLVLVEVHVAVNVHAFLVVNLLRTVVFAVLLFILLFEDSFELFDLRHILLLGGTNLLCELRDIPLGAVLEFLEMHGVGVATALF